MKGFDTFLMEKHCKSFAREQEERRRETYRILNKKLKGRKVASYFTLQSWLGLKKKTMPDREHIFRLAFALELTYEELEEYLQKGALLPGVQINDYQEIIWIYGLQKHLSWDECQDMIQVFEAHICQDVVIEQKTHTDKLWSYYGEWNQLSPEKFLKEMYKQAGMFKGYGKTALKYFVAYKNEILECVRKEAMESLTQELESVGFYEWARENSIEEWEYKEAVLRYVKNETRRKAPRITKEKWREIEHCYWKAYGIQDRNTDLIEQLRLERRNATVEVERNNNPYLKRSDYFIPESVKLFSKNYLSRVLLIGFQKEKEIRTSYILARIRYASEQETCPKEILDYLQEEEIIKFGQKEVTCGEVRNVLKKYIGNQKKRCRIVQREDLLPLILCVAQNRYNALWQEKEEYNQKKAKEIFIDLANVTLTACHMALINVEYELDAWLLDCYREEEMYSFVERLEENRK